MKKMLGIGIILLLSGLAMQFFFTEKIPGYIVAITIGFGLGAGFAAFFTKKDGSNSSHRDLEDLLSRTLLDRIVDPAPTLCVLQTADFEVPAVCRSVDRLRFSLWT